MKLPELVSPGFFLLATTILSVLALDESNAGSIISFYDEDHLQQHDKTERASRVRPKLVLPLPGPGENIDEPIPDYPGDIESLKHFDEFSAGHECTYDNECNGTLRCEPFSPSMAPFHSSVSNTSLSTYAKRSVNSPIHLCSERTCESKCNLTAANTIKCPPDSYTVEWESDDKSCCIQTCKCLPDVCNGNDIVKNNCSSIYKLVRRGTREPGHCCNQIQCIEDTFEPNPDLKVRTNSCTTVENKTYAHGHQWFTGRPECRTCRCHSGAVICDELLPSKSCPLEDKCTNDQAAIDSLAPDQCCPPCKACANPYRSEGSPLYMYQHGERWLIDFSCGECTCINGNAKCIRETCRPPTCEKSQPMQTPEGACCSACICSIDCGSGRPFKRDANGSEVCECADPSETSLTPPQSNTETVRLPNTQGSTISSELLANTPTPPCLESKDGACPSENTSNTSIIAIVVCVLIIVLFLAGWFVGQCLICKPDNSTRGNGNAVSLSDSMQYKKVSSEQPLGSSDESVSLVTVDKAATQPDMGQQANGSHSASTLLAH